MFYILAGCKVSGSSVDITNVMKVFKLIITIIQYLVPVILVLWGSMDLFKAITQGKEEEIKKKQNTLIKRAIAAVLVFILPWAVVTIMGFLGTSVKNVAECYRTTDPGFPDVNVNSGT